MNLVANEKKNVKIKETQIFDFEKKEERKIKIFIFVFLSLLIIFSINWLYKTTGNLTLEQLIFHLKVPLEGTNTDMIWQYIFEVIPISIIISFVAAIIIKRLKNVKNIRLAKLTKHVEIIILFFSVIYVFSKTQAIGYVANQIKSSTFIEENYVRANNENITFPQDKNNLIYIFLESMESTYTSTEHGGIYEDDYISELRELSEENIHFSNTNQLGGAVQLSGTGWTIAGMVAQTSGVPLKISIEQNSYDKYNTFLPGITTLGEILEANGYKNYLLLGSDGTFGGRKNYFLQHGNYSIWDVNTAIENKRMTEEDKIWWGFSDNDLFKYAKEQLTEISQKEEPFNFTILTADTHFPDGYLCSECKQEYDSQYANVISCSSKHVSEFIRWIQEQDFYRNTTIIISGDHLSMQSSLEYEKPDDYKRTIYNCIINPAQKLNNKDFNTTNRDFSTIDMFPTTLAALGVNIKGDRLGLGTNLFSDELTLIEKHGYNFVNDEFEKKSTFYNSQFIYKK